MQSLIEAVKTGEAKQTRLLIEQLLADGVDPHDILNKGLLKAMLDLGTEFRNNEIFIAEVLAAGQAWNQGCAVLREVLVDGSAEPIGRVVIATVEGDMHDIGKNLVAVFMNAAGFETIDLGVDVSAQEIVEAVRKYRPDILALSSLLTVTIKQQEIVMRALKDAGLRDGLTVFVGGAPVTREYCRDIGADVYEIDAAAAAKTAQRMFGRK
ncbi:MAG: cobalamin-dependent protein [Clostridiales Family XIII bacterium]|jgi:5-methyltetrahydrofolate--homocysteine methyltransferase|nr:cobalamin-dependent protein [Clostridiales Family XIII bacterium]